MRVVSYIRVSREEQVEGWSLDAQRDQCAELAALRGWDLLQVFEEPGRSAKTDLRPEFQRMMSRAEVKQFDVIVVHKLDRFSRSLADVVRNVARLKEAGVGLVSVSEPWLDTTTPQGEFMLYLFALLAQWDNENRARETAKGKEQRAKEGYWNGTLNFGYVTIRDLRKELWNLGEQHDAQEISEAVYATRSDELDNYLDQWHDRTEGDAVPHLKNAAGALLAFTYYSTGNVSDGEVAIMLNEAGYRTSGNWGENLFEADTVRPMLQNRFYLGEVPYKGKWYPGRHPAIIPESLFEKCQQARAARRGRTVRGRSKKRTYPLSRLALCARCGKPMRGQANHANHRYYRDPRRSTNICDQKMVRAEDAERQIVEYLANIKLPDDWRERVMQLSQLDQTEVESNDEKRRRWEGQLERARKLYLMGDMEEDDYRTMREDLKGKISALEPMHEPDLEDAAAMLETIGSLLEHANPKELDDVFHALLNSVYLDSGDQGPVVAIEPKPFLKLLMDVSIRPFQPNDDDDDPEPTPPQTPLPDDDGPGDGDHRSHSRFPVEGDDHRSSEVVEGENRDTILADAGQEIVVADKGAMPVAPVAPAVATKPLRVVFFLKISVQHPFSIASAGAI
jgi:DNA invertase Pin-like site-specific DNA recombinase